VVSVSVGDQVLHGRYNTVAVPGDTTLCLAWEKDLMAILDGGA
jgi:co-chaperonin GroES (HSP10)